MDRAQVLGVFGSMSGGEKTVCGGIDRATRTSTLGHRRHQHVMSFTRAPMGA